MVIYPDDIGDNAIRGLSPAFELSEVHTVEYWINRARNDLAQVWNIGAYWAITEVQQTKTGRALHIVGMAGEYDKALFDEIEQFGRATGCNRVYLTGRKGWMKRLTDYKLRTVTMSKEL